MSFVVSILLAFAASALIAMSSGENPIEVYHILLVGSFGSLDSLGYTLFYATPFIFTGLAVTLPYRAGLFNIGAEGQLYMGAVGLTLAQQLFGNLGLLTLVINIVFAFVFAGLWGGLAGFLRAWRGCHEVITTIMLNFISMSLSSYLILQLWKDPLSQRAETVLFHESAWLPRLGLGESPANLSFVLALGAAFAAWFFLEKTRMGFQLRAIGFNPSASRVSGASVGQSMILAMLLGGALASGAAANEILGNSHRFLDGFSTGYGFVGIAVAFLGRNHPLGVVLAGIFFGALFKGSSELEIELNSITRDFSVVLQALIIAAVASENGIRRWLSSGSKNG